MKRTTTMTIGMALVATMAHAQGATPLKKCAADAVISGTVCMDTYEASVWRVPGPTTINAALVQKIQQSKATAAMLVAGGATQLGVGAADDYAPCANDGQNCQGDVYAVSLPGVRPSANVTWFQAQAACKNARKRLPSNAEWQAAVIGTPDSGPDDGTSDCNTNGTFATVGTGVRSGCRSADGAFDMVGNVAEWVADWVPRSGVCGGWSWGPGTSFVPDLQCFAGTVASGEPGALVRGGDFGMASEAGPFAIDGTAEPSSSSDGVGFRCAR